MYFGLIELIASALQLKTAMLHLLLNVILRVVAKRRTTQRSPRPHVFQPQWPHMQVGLMTMSNLRRDSAGGGCRGRWAGCFEDLVPSGQEFVGRCQSRSRILCAFAPPGSTRSSEGSVLFFCVCVVFVMFFWGEGGCQRHHVGIGGWVNVGGGDLVVVGWWRGACYFTSLLDPTCFHFTLLLLRAFRGSCA